MAQGGGAVTIRCYKGHVIATIARTAMTVAAIAIGCPWGVVMDGTGGIGRGSVTGIATRPDILQDADGGTINTSATGVITLIGIHMAQRAAVAMNGNDDIFICSGVMTGSSTTTTLGSWGPYEGGGRMTTMGSGCLFVPMTSQTAGRIAISSDHVTNCLGRATGVACKPSGVMAGGAEAQVEGSNRRPGRYGMTIGALGASSTLSEISRLYRYRMAMTMPVEVSRVAGNTLATTDNGAAQQ